MESDTETNTRRGIERCGNRERQIKTDREEGGREIGQKQEDRRD